MPFIPAVLKKFPSPVDLLLGVLIMGVNGAVIGSTIGGPLVTGISAALGIALGAFIATLQARVFFVSVLSGMVIGGLACLVIGRPDVLIVGAGSGAAIGGFIGVNIDLYRKGSTEGK
ncbi:MAG TPA: hypothetical protein VIU33_03785 [Nitrospiria bacterium]